MEALEDRLGYRFRDSTYLDRALTHSSYANEQGHPEWSNERLEFLGDSLLGFCAARTIFSLEPPMPEGDLTRLRAQLVCEASLYRTASRLELGKYMKLGNSTLHNGGRSIVSIQADCVEAVIAAIYLDGGLEPAEQFIAENILKDLKAGYRPVPTDFKSQLQELVQKSGDSTPSYAIVGQSGPDHNKTFVARVSVPGGRSFQGTGRSKKEAEQAAAKAALERMKR